MLGSLSKLVISISCSFCVVACGWDKMKEIEEPLKLAAADDKTIEISVEQLERGQEQYILYCRACHGVNGDGRGPAGIGLIPPPRDFTSESLAFKFGGVEAGELPPDSELRRIIKGGLSGTAMLPWDIPDQVLDDIIPYIKTFNPIWTEDAPGEVVEIGDDPWKGKEKEGSARGKKVYHGLAQCLQCHPAYATQQEIYDDSKELTGNPIASFRPSMFEPEAKKSEAFGNIILPPDFGRHPIKAGSTPKDLFRTIAVGIGGTAMPMWKGSIPDDDIWAIAHFVSDIAKTLDKPAYRSMMNTLRAAPAFTPPPAPEEGEGEGDPPPEGDEAEGAE